MKLGIIGAMESEVELLQKKMSDRKVVNMHSFTFYDGKLSGVNVVIVQCGIGKTNAAFCASHLILVFGETHILNTGVAGGTLPDMNIFDMVLSTDAVQHDFDVTPLGYKRTEIPGMKTSVFQADFILRELAEKAFAQSSLSTEHKIFSGRVASGDVFVSDEKTKNEIIKTCKPSCIEMEGASIAQVCFLSRIPFLIVRSISDSASGKKGEYEFNEKLAAEKSATLVFEMINFISKTSL